jgi:UDP-3-O-acyl-N-acetylglucosamine deacetylase
VDVEINDAPRGILSAPLEQTENTATGTTIGTLSVQDANVGDTHTWSLVSGQLDNASFNLTTGGTLSNAVVFDYETKINYEIRVNVEDQGGLDYTQNFAVTVLDQNETPYGLTLSNNSQRENTVTGTTIGTFTGLDVDQNETFTYALTGSGNDNSSFTLTTAGVLKKCNRIQL